MAWRIDEAVIRGEIDNRIRGRVIGRLWLVGRAEPVRLDLQGNCWRDLAGCRLQFTSPAPRAVDLDGLVALQAGVVGDMTASRKVRVPVQAAEPFASSKRLASTLHLEWFSTRNCRVMIETASFELTILGEAAWLMSPEEEHAQREATGARITGYMRAFG